MQENGAEQPKVYRCTRIMLKVSPTPTVGKQTAQMKEWSTETRSIKSNIPAIPYGARDYVTKNSQRYASSNTVQPPLPRLDLSVSDFSETGRKARLQNHCVQVVLHCKMHLMHKRHHMHQGHASQHVKTLKSQPRCLVTNLTCKDTIAPGLVDCQLKMLNFELYTYFIVLCTGLVQNMPN